jgi:hypothetical protein
MFLNPTPELPDDTPIDHVRFATRIRNVLNAAGIKTVGGVRKTRVRMECCSVFKISGK